MASSQSDPEAGVASSTKQGQGEGLPGNAESKLYEFKEQLLLLSTLVATVTYVAGLNLPGGSWEQDDPGGYMAGDPILRDTHYQRYLAFYYCNATALAASLVVSLILIIQEKKDRVWTVVLRVVMVLDLLSLMGAYAAGSCRDAFTTIYAAVAFFLVVLVVISVFFAFFYYLCLNGAIKVHSGSSSSPNSNHKHISNSNLNPDSNSDSISNSNSNPVSNTKPISFAIAGRRIQTQSSVVKLLTDTTKQEKEQIDVLMLLATFAVAITYVAGLSPPGGFWNSTQHGHHLSDPVLQARGRYRAFFVCNTTSFAMSLLIIVLLLEKKMLKNKKLVSILVRPVALYGLISIALLCLMGAYAAGSCREADNTVFVLALAGAVPVCVCLQLVLVTYCVCVQLALVTYWKGLATKCACVLEWFKARFNTPRGTSIRKNNEQHIQNTRYLVMLLATLVVTITYQAGLDPPGGLWLDSRDGHTIGHPVLQTTHPTRYQVFFYSNSAAFVTSLVVIMMLQSKYLLTRHTLEAALVLDLFGLVTSYGAGSTRDVNASFYIIALAGIVLVYVIVHITIIDHAPEPEDGAAVLKDLDDKRKVLLLVAILAATLTYQAGLTPPGGFWIADDQGHGRRAGFPVLLDNYPRRYHAFFYSNAASFMASVTLILLLVNPKLYRPGIRCYALYLCMLVGMLGLMGAYAAGSSRHLMTSIYVLALVAAVSVFIALPVFLCWFFRTCAKAKAGQGCLFWCFRKCVKAKAGQGNNNNNGDDNTNAADTTIITTNNNAADATTNNNVVAVTTTATTNNNNVVATTNTNNAAAATTTTTNDNNSNEEKDRLEYLMLLGILGASMTYQTGLRPPGGLWQDNIDGYSAGNPILHDINKHRYNAFFYSNSTSFMASIVVVFMLLPLTIKKYRDRNLPLWPMHTAILLDMISLLVAYAAGSTREWETSRHVMFLIIPVLVYIAVYVTASVFYHRKDAVKPPTSTPAHGAGLTATPHQDAK